MGPSAASSLSEADLDFLVGQTTSLVEFATRSVHPDGGFAWLDDEGHPLLDRPVELWITCRMLHVLAVAEILGDSSLAPLVDSGVAALTGRLRDGEYTGWFASVSSAPDAAGSEAGSAPVSAPVSAPGSAPIDDSKQTYAHAFVVLAAASAAAAGHEAARPLLDEALVVFDRHLWRDADGMVVDAWNRAFTELDPYRGVNANMHTVEALLAAHDVTGDEIHLQRALTITSRVVHDFAAGNGYRLPEHYDEQWQAIPDYNRDQPRDRFRPYGVTIGHLLEWARLALHVRSALKREGIPTPDWLQVDAQALFERAVEDGWQQASDGAPEGFVYTTDFDANPVVSDRLHWVVAEAIATAWTLALLTGDPAYRQWFDRWVEHARTYFVDEVHGSWHHELDEQNHPSSNVWEGKPDVYHAYQAMLLPRLGEVTSFVDGATRLVP